MSSTTPMGSSCTWAIDQDQLRPLLGAHPPARGHRIEDAGQTWWVEYATPDTTDARGWVVSTYYDEAATTGAAERAR